MVVRIKLLAGVVGKCLCCLVFVLIRSYVYLMRVNFVGDQRGELRDSVDAGLWWPMNQKCVEIWGDL